MIFKKICTWFSLIFMLLSTAFGFVNPPPETGDVTYFKAEGATMTIIENGSSEYKIVIGANAAPSERYAAQKLSYYLKQISGVELETVTDDTPEAVCEIIVGKTNREQSGYYAIDRDSLGAEGFSIKTFETKVVIAGGEKRGTLYGVYSFLEKYFNCRWFTKDLIQIPQSDKVVVPTLENVTEKAYLEYRETDWISPRDVEYSMANKQNGNIYRHLTEEQGGNFSYAVNGFAHTLTNSIVSASKYFDEHPEYFALGVRSGERTRNQLCLTNPDTLRIAIEDVLSTIRQKPDVQIISVTQHDNQDYCVCENCKAIDDEEGAHSGTLLRFINAIADAVKAAGYDNIAVDTFAYQYTRSAPKITVPRDNVIVRFCTIECCFSHPIATCDDSVSLRKDMEDWKKICNRVYVWDYTTNYANYLAPFPNFGVIQQNLQYFVENNVVGVYEEGNYTASQCNGEFAELRAYLLTKLLWNPYIDMDAAMNEFLQAYYGDGWKSIRKYIDITTQNTGRYTLKGQQHMGIYASTGADAVLYLNNNQIDYCEELWQQAFEKADEQQTQRLKLSEISWRYWKACNKVLEFSRTQKSEKWQQANEQFYNDLKAMGIIRLNESNMLTDTPDFTQTPDKWKAQA